MYETPEKWGKNKAKALAALAHNRIMKSASLSYRYINNTRQTETEAAAAATEGVGGGGAAAGIEEQQLKQT